MKKAWFLCVFAVLAAGCSQVSNATPQTPMATDQKSVSARVFVVGELSLAYPPSWFVVDPSCRASVGDSVGCAIETEGSSIEVDSFPATTGWINRELADQSNVKSVRKLDTSEGIVMYRIEHMHSASDESCLADALWPAVTYLVSGGINAYLITGAFHPTDKNGDSQALATIDSIVQTSEIQRRSKF